MRAATKAFHGRCEKKWARCECVELCVFREQHSRRFFLCLLCTFRYDFLFFTSHEWVCTVNWIYFSRVLVGQKSSKCVHICKFRWKAGLSSAADDWESCQEVKRVRWEENQFDFVSFVSWKSIEREIFSSFQPKIRMGLSKRLQRTNFDGVLRKIGCFYDKIDVKALKLLVFQSIYGLVCHWLFLWLVDCRQPF